MKPLRSRAIVFFNIRFRINFKGLISACLQNKHQKSKTYLSIFCKILFTACYFVLGSFFIFLNIEYLQNPPLNLLRVVGF